MNRDQQLDYCKVCKNQKVSIKYGILCRLTNQVADFENSCNSFDEDAELKSRLERVPERGYRSAAMGKRFLNYLLDSIFFLFFCTLIGVIVGIVIAVMSPSSLSIIEEDNSLLNYLIGFIIMTFYYTTMESLTGRTFGKFITKTKVIDQHGEIPGFTAILLRSICRFIPFDAFSFLGDPDQGWHDQLSKTRVVEV